MESLMRGEIQAFLEENGGKRNGYYERELLTHYVRHNYNNFDHGNKGMTPRKHIIADRIKYLNKQNKQYQRNTYRGIEENDYLEYDNDMEFYNWILSLKPNDERDEKYQNKSSIE